MASCQLYKTSERAWLLQGGAELLCLKARGDLKSTIDVAAVIEYARADAARQPAGVEEVDRLKALFVARARETELCG